MLEDKKKQLEQQLWNIANTLRGKMDADDFRDYILGFIFYKYLSTKMDLYANTILRPDGLTFPSKMNAGCGQIEIYSENSKEGMGILNEMMDGENQVKKALKSKWNVHNNDDDE